MRYCKQNTGAQRMALGGHSSHVLVMGSLFSGYLRFLLDVWEGQMGQAL